MAEGIDDACRAEAGNIKYDYFRAVDDSDELLLVEKWQDAAALTAHGQQPHFARLGKIKTEFVEDTVIENTLSDKYTYSVRINMEKIEQISNKKTKTNGIRVLCPVPCFGFFNRFRRKPTVLTGVFGGRFGAAVRGTFESTRHFLIQSHQSCYTSCLVCILNRHMPA